MAPRLVERPSQYDSDVGGELCRRLSSGRSLRDICEDIEMPTIEKVFDWIQLVDSFAQQYARARSTQAEVLADEIISLSNNCRLGEIVTIKDGPLGIETRTVTADMIERSKLQIQARQWFASKVAPHKYGDRVAHQMLDEHGKPAKAGITVIIDGAPRQIE